ncbi:hypothetical protein [Roseicella aquatilis]|uniref:Uncharacterized protein n=1 Tax=Roseicella aquatilis TaxID=2527868 RepID=A0A4V2WM69_9PROT|nr:hypothetical protein [Roseicella aquatilis]TCZ66680.1 hypothetical protein EXY23_00775 [Roseicella aquatilis]
MDDSEDTAPAGLPESAAWFVVISHGREAQARVVAGLDGVRAALAPILRAVAPQGLPDGAEDLLAALGDPGPWRRHGIGDGRPYWHLWLPLGDGSVAVQRLTVPPEPGQAGAGAAAIRQAMRPIEAELRSLAAELALLARQEPRG